MVLHGKNTDKVVASLYSILVIADVIKRVLHGVPKDGCHHLGNCHNEVGLLNTGQSFGFKCGVFV